MTYASRDTATPEQRQRRLDRLVRAARNIVARRRAQAATARESAVDGIIVDGIADLLLIGLDADDRLRAEAVSTAASALEVFRTDTGVERRG